ncbi:hypothetical protein PHYSODRAFT_297986 [Phytophthora sojae]|uniref:Ankyrin repeat-containing domain n=1 Tax=Phytophthora sojae (strain P6497) TaxID=1094619 RepID=G4Z4B0_PHYSP|nr:hypothetical protein PHYSODRAFT_297986 [Phytophthora sojae]EGZ19416.1 hypothetical protein PHYSODRAFT_297986 [Phytophthora sojae]|eukprot:XP_009522133.1 hypothetical protein PHYSODRAFT_297986 [Phytophthora sojae]
MSLARACELSHVGSVSPLDLVWMRSLRDAKSPRWTIAKLLQRCVVTRDVVEEAARCGQLGMLQLLEREKTVEGMQWSMSSLNEAAEHGHWSVVRWLFGRLNSTLEEKMSNKAVVESAVKRGIGWLWSYLQLKVSLAALRPSGQFERRL